MLSSEKSLLNGNWLPRTAFNTNVPLYKKDLKEEGCYKVSVKIKAKENISDLRIFSSRRNLMARDIKLKAGEIYEKTFYIRITPYYPAMTSKISNDTNLYITVSDENAIIENVTAEKADVPTLWVAGDSTVTDQNALYPYFPTASCAGWPQFIMTELEGMALCNLAHSGMTTNCFCDDGHWKIIQDRIKKGDVVLFQFGHNDQKRRNLQAFSGYMQNLRRYVNETLSFGAYPILVTPISRIPFEDNGEYRSILLNHALAVKLVADEYNIPYIDMHDMTFDFWTNDIDKAHLYFMPGDITHTNDFGAILLADMASKKIQDDKIEPLYKHLKYKPLPEDFFESAEKSRKEKIPMEKSSNVFDIEVPYVDMNKSEYKDGIVKAFRYGLLDPCVMYIHPEDFMPKAQVLMVLFKALRLSGKRPYLYHFVDISKYEWDSSYVQTCIDEDLLDKTLFTNDMFYPDSPLTEKEFASLAIRGMHKKDERNKLTVNDCLKEAREKGILSKNENISDEDSKMGNYIITRGECYTALARIVELAGKKNEALPKDAELHPSL